jgi:hypothetical protein
MKSVVPAKGDAKSGDDGIGYAATMLGLFGEY